MATIELLRVFVSYARKDGIALASDLGRQGFNIWLDTNRIASGSIWSGEIERAIDCCQVMVALITSGSYGSEICRSDQIRALDRGKRLILVLAETNADRPIFLYCFGGLIPLAPSIELAPALRRLERRPGRCCSARPKLSSVNELRRIRLLWHAFGRVRRWPRLAVLLHSNNGFVILFLATIEKA